MIADAGVEHEVWSILVEQRRGILEGRCCRTRY